MQSACHRAAGMLDTDCVPQRVACPASVAFLSIICRAFLLGGSHFILHHHSLERQGLMPRRSEERCPAAANVRPENHFSSMVLG